MHSSLFKPITSLISSALTISPWTYNILALLTCFFVGNCFLDSNISVSLFPFFSSNYFPNSSISVSFSPFLPPPLTLHNVACIEYFGLNSNLNVLTQEVFIWTSWATNAIALAFLLSPCLEFAFPLICGWGYICVNASMPSSSWVPKPPSTIGS